MKIKWKQLLISILAASIGCLICAFNVNCIIKPNGLNSTGITGVSILLEYITNYNYTYFYYAFVIIILIVTLITLGKKEVTKIIFLSILFPSLLLLLQTTGFTLLFEDKIIAVICVGFLNGIGVGLCFRFGFSFGGTDTIAKIINKKILPFVNLTNILLGIEAIVVIGTGIILGFEVAIYAMIAQFIGTKIIDYVVFGMGYELYKHEILTDKADEISEFILSELGRGVTITEVIGGYSKTNKQKVSCVCSPKESIRIKKRLAEIDEKAYVEILPIASVWGQGKRFKSIGE